jgi:bifunctional non-homologous end joining protein LigD
MVWDLGKYEPLEDQPPEEQLALGKVQIVLQGEKLRGGFTLIQIKNRFMKSGQRDYWLLVKSRDEYADPSWDIDSARFDRSVLTGRTMKEIKEGKPAKPRVGRHRV